MVRADSNISIVWESFLSGDKEAFAFLYNLHVDELYCYGTKLSMNKELVKDAIQEVFLDLYLKREKNKTNPENLKYYLILSLKRNLIKKLKRLRKLVHDETNELLFEPEYSVEKTIIDRELSVDVKRRVSNALNQLPPKQKEALYLRFNESLEYNEIAEILNISIESVRKQVYRALKTIRELLGHEAFILWLM
ncbi:MAG: sigma-70 family RNA polymerase sigma factor [Prolixibacteraceae bacterium]|jgi:RNA polymerase sigma factor (sigma-70 family)|nr:sigma-70 family RNA polymerase sigma factor [Prolixibacteraceae bacterium]MBT6764212.1 sigma-70 family RNA polymerase sigma factor [Prolixibacteraceae bacterium]MBT6999090.1 sigma-70 family RNA polymerase sigma factor [Prolixibacteraceae bacterium]MBT7396857.1 sigma-70 family RNA polymerase sigma factor [Prolixibacteraceae bacterium]